LILESVDRLGDHAGLALLLRDALLLLLALRAERLELALHLLHLALEDLDSVVDVRGEDGGRLEGDQRGEDDGKPGGDPVRLFAEHGGHLPRSGRIGQEGSGRRSPRASGPDGPLRFSITQAEANRVLRRIRDPRPRTTAPSECAY